MNANELAEDLEGAKLVILRLNEMLRQQQAEMDELEKENTDLRYLIATKLEQQDGISLNSMSHPITNTPEPSYEIDPDKLETIEIDLPSLEPVAWMPIQSKHTRIQETKPDDEQNWIPLYLHPVKEQDTECQYCKQGCIRCDARKQLTDEEIIKAYEDMLGVASAKGSAIDFARAILRKAQE